MRELSPISWIANKKERKMSTKAKRHIHKYHHISMNGSKIWACALPDCNHYMPLHLNEMVPGKGSFCWNCNDSIILGPDNMDLDKPLCNDCRLMSDGKLKELLERVSGS